MNWLEVAKQTAQQWQASQPPQVPNDLSICVLFLRIATTAHDE